MSTLLCRPVNMFLLICMIPLSLTVPCKTPHKSLPFLLCLICYMTAYLYFQMFNFV